LTTRVFDKLLESTVYAGDAITSDSDQAVYSQEEVGERFKQITLPQSVVESVATFASRSGSPTFAVRSSAVAEDSASASFAGQFDTFLGVVAEELDLHAKLCFASYFSERLAVYRSRNKGNASAPGIAVVIQEMVEPDYAGVMLTVDPLDHDSLALEVVQGRGDKLVSGDVTPAGYKISRQTCDIGSSYESISVSPELLRAIATVGLQVERLYGAPQDIEFAVRDRKIYILQSRPVVFFSRGVTDRHVHI
jgi:pyruvate,water dikinase